MIKNCPKCNSKDLMIGEYSYYVQTKIFCNNCKTMFATKDYKVFEVKQESDMDWKG